MVQTEKNEFNLVSILFQKKNFRLYFGVKISAKNVDEINPWCQFHQHFKRKFFPQI